MDDSKVFMFPEGATNSSIDPNLLLALNNNGGFGGNGNWIWILFLWMMWGGYGNGNGFNNNGGTGFISNQLNNNAGRDLLLQAINGRADSLGQLANILNTSVENVKSGIYSLNASMQTLGGQIGMTGLEVRNSIDNGNAVLGRQLCECCCENRLAICNQTNALQSQAASNFAATQLEMAKNEAADQLSVCQQTNALTRQADGNTNSILNAIAAQTTAMTKEFCDLKERELQNRIDAQGDIITQLRNQISNDHQTLQFNAAFHALDDKIDAIAAKQPNTVPVTWPNLVAANATPYVGQNYSGFYGNGFGNNILF